MPQSPQLSPFGTIHRRAALACSTAILTVALAMPALGQTSVYWSKDDGVWDRTTENWETWAGFSTKFANGNIARFRQDDGQLRTVTVAEPTGGIRPREIIVENDVQLAFTGGQLTGGQKKFLIRNDGELSIGNSLSAANDGVIELAGKGTTVVTGTISAANNGVRPTVVSNSSGTLIFSSSARIAGYFLNRSEMRANGTQFDGIVRNRATECGDADYCAILTDTSVSGAVINGGSMEMTGTATDELSAKAGKIENYGEMLLSGVQSETVTNGGGADVATLTLRGRIDSAVDNRQDADLTLDGATVNGSLKSAGDIKLRGQSAVTDIEINKSGRLDADLAGSGLTVGKKFSSSGQLGSNGSRLAVSSSVDAETPSIFLLAGTRLSSSVAFKGGVATSMSASDVVTKDISVDGKLTNSGDLDVRGAALSVTNGPETRGTIENAWLATLRSDTKLDADIVSKGKAFLSGDITGDVTTVGRAELTLGSRRWNGSRSANITGDVRSTGSFRLEGDTTVTGSVVVAGGVADLSSHKMTAASFTNNAESTLGRIDVTGQILNWNKLVIRGDAKGNIRNQGGGAKLTTWGRVDGSIDLDGGDSEIGGDVTGTVTLSRESSKVLFSQNSSLGSASTGAGLVIGAGATAAIGAGSNTWGTVTSDVDLSGNVNVASTLRGKVSGTAGSLVDVANTGRVEGNIDTSGKIAVRGRVDGAVTVSETGRFEAIGDRADIGSIESSGTALVAKDANLSTKAFVNRGDLTVAGTVNLVGNDGQTLTNHGNLASSGRIDGTLENAAGATSNLSGDIRTVKNAGTVVVDKDRNLAVSDRLVNQDGATLNVNGSISGAGNPANVINEATGTIVLGAGSAIFGNVQNNGTTQLVGQSRIGGDFINTGALNNEGAAEAVDFNVSGRLTNDGSISALNGNAINITAGNVTNNGTISGTVFFDGALDNYQDLKLNGGSLGGDVNNRPSGSLSIAGTVDANGNEIFNSGTMSIAKAATLRDVEQVTNSNKLVSLGTIDGRLVNEGSGTAELAGQVTGTVTNAGDMSLHDGFVIGSGEPGNGVLYNSGNVAGIDGSAANGLTAGRVVNSGSIALKDYSGDIESSSGAVSLTGVTGGNVAASGGTLTSKGTIDGSVKSGAQTELAGKVGKDLEVFGGQTKITADLAVAGDVKVTGGSLNIPASNVAGNQRALTAQTVAITGADTSASVADSGKIAAKFIVVSDRASVTSAGTLAGAIKVDKGSTLRSTGTITGDLTTDGRAELSGHAGSITVAREGELNIRAPLTATSVMNNGNVDQQDTLDAAKFSNSSTGTYALAGRLVGDAENAGQMTVADGGAVSGTITNNQRLDAQGAMSAQNIINTASGKLRMAGRLSGSVDTSGDATILAGVSEAVTYHGGTLRFSEPTDRSGRAIAVPVDLGKTFRMTGGAVDITPIDYVSVDRTIIQDTATLNVAGRLDSAITNDGKLNLTGTVRGNTANAGEMTLTNGSAVDGTLTNTGTISATGRSTMGGLSSANGVVDLQNGSTADELVVGRGGISGGKFLMDAGLITGSETRDIDRISSQGAITGALTFDFDVDGSVGAGQIGERTQIIAANAPAAQNTFTVASVTGLPTVSEQLIYGVQRDDTGNVYMITDVNPAAGALAGNVTLTQSLIGSVVNRPTSPLVGGLATGVEENPCGTGAWGRFIGGRADATGGTRNSTGTYDSKISATYRGIQVGGDFACFGGHYSGWDMAFGALGGVNDGSTEQPVYATSVTDPSKLSSTMSSITKADFHQVYGGLYMTASKDRIVADLQIRRERTDFDIVNTPVAGSGTQGLLLDDEFSSNATTISGSLSYIVPMSSPNWSLTPTAGFALTNTSTDQIKFKNGAKLKIEDAKARVAFVGASLSRTEVAADDRSAYTGFATGTFYKDFSDSTASQFTTSIDGQMQSPERLVSDNLGAYGEISVGVNYVRILEQRGKSAPRQFNASLRLDGRTGDTLDSVGVTGQMRFQF
ncbi:MAG: hypothetical protein DI498_00095 [Paracoccus denitrificans]|nr:MAG: hypothetical protein DI498_00095 [Paracoccus denitrificans]PZO86176.1 MAG: hypothetical protein DI633_00095 [Paracoccus denitrificans]